MRSSRNDVLKIIAIATMVVDHVGLLFVPHDTVAPTIGRLAFPLFAWQVAESVLHTSSRVRYLGRLFAFGCISQWPFVYLNPEAEPDLMRVNVMFQLLTGALLVIAADAAADAWRRSGSRVVRALAASSWGCVVFTLVALPDAISVCLPGFQFSYGSYGQVLFLVFHVLRRRMVAQVMAYSVLSLWHGIHVVALLQTTTVGFAGIHRLLAFWLDPHAVADAFHLAMAMGGVALDGPFFQARSIIVLPIIWLLRGRAGPVRLNKWVAYWFYPLHIAALVVVARW